MTAVTIEGGKQFNDFSKMIINTELQACLEDAVGSVQTTAIKQVTRIFQFPNAYKSYIYSILSSIKCATALCLKKCAYFN